MTSQFEIAFTEDCWIDEGTPFRSLRLSLQDIQEVEHADLTCWSAKDYEAQWITELTRIVTSQNKGALITSMHDPAHASQVWTWTMWKKDDNVLFQNRILFLLEPNQTFDPVRVSEYLGEYKSHSEDGHPLSEWTVPITAIRDFISKRSVA